MLTLSRQSSIENRWQDFTSYLNTENSSVSALSADALISPSTINQGELIWPWVSNLILKNIDSNLFTVVNWIKIEDFAFAAEIAQFSSVAPEAPFQLINNVSLPQVATTEQQPEQSLMQLIQETDMTDFNFSQIPLDDCECILICLAWWAAWYTLVICEGSHSQASWAL